MLSRRICEALDGMPESLAPSSKGSPEPRLRRRPVRSGTDILSTIFDDFDRSDMIGRRKGSFGRRRSPIALFSCPASKN